MSHLQKLLEEAEGKIAEEIVVAKETLVDTAPIIKQEPVIIQYDRKPDIPVSIMCIDIEYRRYKPEPVIIQYDRKPDVPVSLMCIDNEYRR